MARYRGPVVRLCRREGVALDIGPKCGKRFDKRPFPPGQHGWKRGKLSEFGKQLREKQVLKRTFNVLEKQFQRYFRMAGIMKGNTGTNLLRIFEQRLDNVIYRLGFASSRPQGRQMIVHGHYMVNGKRVTVPSYPVKPGDTITVRNRDHSRELIKNLAQECKTHGVTPPSWLEADIENLTGRVLQFPTREEFPFDIREQVIIEGCSK